MKKINVNVVVILLAIVTLPMSSMAMEKSYKKINGKAYLRCQPVPDYSGKVNNVNVGSAGDWWLIKMKPSAAWNSPRCVATGNELVFENGKPVKNVICGNNIVGFEKIQQKAVAKDACEDIPWDAVGIWADFPEGAIGSETQLRTEGLRYKYKLVTRKGNKIYATKCFKKENIWSLADLSARWGVKLSTFKTFGNKGDGGNLATLVIGVVK